MIHYMSYYQYLKASSAGEMLMSLNGIDGDQIKSESKLLDSDKTYPYTAGTSWTILSENTAYKKVDNTLVKESATGIPQEIVLFFTRNNFDINQSIDLKVSIKENEFDISLHRKNDGRHKLTLSSVKSKLKLSRLNIAEDTLWFERDLDNPNQFYAYTKSSNSKITTQLRKKPNKPGKRSSQTNS